MRVLEQESSAGLERTRAGFGLPAVAERCLLSSGVITCEKQIPGLFWMS